jgi:hypothetical protein
VEIGNSKSLYALGERLSRLKETDEGDRDRALRWIQQFVERIFTEPLCTSQVAGSRLLDEFCQAVGKANLAALQQPFPKTQSPQGNGPVFVYIVTKLQRSGGHSRVIEDFVLARPDARHVLLATGLSGKSESAHLMYKLSGKVEISFESARPRDNHQQRLDWLQRRLLALRPARALLFNHHQDSVAIAAVQPDMGADFSFYHHADHHLCLGVHLPGIEHIDPHPMGYHHCRDELGIDNIYIPLTMADLGARDADWAYRHDGTLTTCTAARSNKVEVPYFVSYPEVVPRLIEATGGRHIHIGRLTPWARLKIRRGLRRLGIPSGRFVYLPWVPSVWRALHEHEVDLYVASFPYGGGLTLIEAMGAGVPVVLHEHIFSRVLSGIDLAYPDVLTWRQPDKLLTICSGVSAARLADHGRLARKQYEDYHRPAVLERSLGADRREFVAVPGLSKGYRAQRDEFAAWLESQVSIGHLIRRFLYRSLRAFRNVLS